MTQLLLDIMRGWLTIVLFIGALILIMYFVLPGLGADAKDRGRAFTALFGGMGLFVTTMFIGGLIAAWWHS